MFNKKANCMPLVAGKREGEFLVYAEERLLSTGSVEVGYTRKLSTSTGEDESIGDIKGNTDFPLTAIGINGTTFYISNIATKYTPCIIREVNNNFSLYFSDRSNSINENIYVIGRNTLNAIVIHKIWLRTRLYGSVSITDENSFFSHRINQWTSVYIGPSSTPPDWL